MRLLTKAYRPLPEKWHGLTDVETRYRQRYVDLGFYAANRRATAWMASTAARKEELVWLPGSDFGNGRAPDLNDKPFVLLSEPLHGKTIYWLCESHPTMMFPLGYKFLVRGVIQ